ELRGVDLRDIAEATNISLRFLQALEQDRTDVLPGGIFPKAFVRQYATYLGLDPDRLATEYAYSHGGGAAAEAGAVARRASSRPRARSSSPWETPEASRSPSTTARASRSAARERSSATS